MEHVRSDPVAFANADENGPHTPGVSRGRRAVAGANSPISGFGVETVGIDAGQAGGIDPPFPAHYFLLGADKYGLTQLQNLDQLPATGSLLWSSAAADRRRHRMQPGLRDRARLSWLPSSTRGPHAPDTSRSVGRLGAGQPRASGTRSASSAAATSR